MTRRVSVSTLIAVTLLTAVGCGAKAAKLQAEQTLTLKGDTPVALLVEGKPEDHDICIEITSDQPVDVSLVAQKAVDEAIAIAQRHDAAREAYGKSNAKNHKVELVSGPNVQRYLVIWQAQPSGRATVQIKRTK